MEGAKVYFYIKFKAISFQFTRKGKLINFIKSNTFNKTNFYKECVQI